MRDNVYPFPASRHLRSPASASSNQQRYLDEITRLFAQASPRPKPNPSKEESLITRLECVVTRLENLIQ